MRFRKQLFIRLPDSVFILALLSACIVLAIAAEELPDHAPGMVIIKFAVDDRSEIDTFLSRSGAYSAERVFPNVVSSSGDPLRLSAVYQLKFSPDADIASIVYEYEKDPVVDYAQPNYLNYPCSVNAPDDFFYGKQWGLQVIEAPDAWEVERGSQNVVVAVVDTGVDYTHEDLASRIWINPGEIDGNGVDDDGNGYVDDIRGWDFADSPALHTDIDHRDRDNDPMDENSHGTHVAGIIGAVPDNSVGTAGVNWNCRIMALRGGGDFLEDDDVSAAIVYATDNGARIINMSWGGDHLAYIVRDATKYAYDRGVILVAAVGNDDRPAVIYPALYKHIIAVGATNRWDEKASFSNYGPGVDIAAPGDRIFSTVLNNKYSALSGTSMASPMVAGVTALMIARRPTLTNDEVAQILRSSADEIDEPLFAGAGRVNAAKALTGSSPLIARITAPESGAGGNLRLTIQGTAAGSQFRRFGLEYTVVSETDWIPIGDFKNTPVFDDSLGIWDVANFDEGDYVLRLRVFGDGNLTAEDKVILNIDHSPPEMADLRVITILYADTHSYIVTWRTDDLASGELYYRPAGSKSEFQRMMTSSVTSTHSLQVSGELPPGNYEYFVEATNQAGLATTDDNNGAYYPLEIKFQQVTSDGFFEMVTGIPAMHPVGKTADFDGDGQLEIVGMSVDQFQYDETRIYERGRSGGYSKVFVSDEDYFPWDMGDTDGDGLFEILGNKKDVTFLHESLEAGLYPTERIWEMEGIRGGQIADMDLDGQKEIIARKLDGNEILVYENRDDNFYLRAARLLNPTEGHNGLSETFAISDLDGDGQTEIAIGDGDGDLFVYENTDNDRYTHTWTGSVPYSTIKYVTAGDLDGDGTDEFVVGARAVAPSNLAREKSKFTRWVYTIFDNIGQDEYEAVWSQEIIGVRLEGGMSTGDVDGDGRDEVAVLVVPSLYIFEYVEHGIYESLWYHPASNIGRPVIMDLDADGVNSLLFNNEDELLAFEYIQTGDASVRRPWGVIAVPLSENEVELHWNGPPGTSSYNIHRGTSAERLSLITSIQNKGKNWEVISEQGRADMGYFRDESLKTETKYWYAISSVNAAGQESTRSETNFATPNAPPRLLSAEYVPPSTVVIVFSEPMGLSAKDQAHYTIKLPSGLSKTSSSAILDSQGHRVVLTVDDLSQGGHTITASGVWDTTGVLISANDNSAAFHVPATEISVWSDLSSMIVYPNPVMPSSRHSALVTFGNLPPATTISIYSYGGQLVRDLGEVESGQDRKFWYLDNNQHQDVASGTYIYVVESAGDSKTGKIAVIR
ncbi:S8 family serine peptidase [Candidatus Poribacteria bacterium]